MKRKLFHFVTVISILAWLHVVVFWLRSLSGSDYLTYYSPTFLTQYNETPVMEAGTYPHEIWWIVRRFPAGPTAASCCPGVRFGALNYEWVPSLWKDLGWFGFGLTWGSHGRWTQSVQAGKWEPPTQFIVIKFPFWPLPILFSILPVLWYRRWAARRLCILRCKGCGYDLRGAVDSCSECGLAVGQK